MTKELQDLAWSVLPKEFKEELKNTYFRAQNNGNEQAVYFMAYLFGHHNLTSDAEGEEMLIVPRKKVQEMWQRAYEQETKYSKAERNPTTREELYYNRGILSILNTLFGSKCLPDEENVETSDRNVDSLEQKTAKPKFKAGDKIRIIKGGSFHGRIGEVTDIDFDGNIALYETDRSYEWFSESDLEPCTEPKAGDLDVAGDLDKSASTFTDECKSRERLQIAAMAMQGMLSNADRMKQYGEIAMRESENLIQLVARNAIRYAEALIAGCEKKGDNQ